MSGSEEPTRIDGPTRSGSRSDAGSAGSRQDWDPALEADFERRGTLGRGATGVVYRALQRSSGREVALKLATGQLDDHRLARFAREGELTARLDHPGIVTVHAAGQVRGRPWIAYELVTGAGTLDRAWASAPLRRRVELLRDAARALGHAHDQGVVHRDVKPENVLVDREGRVRVADFGLAGALDVQRLTQTGAMLGTPSYMAPELYEGRRDEVGPATDVWALGVMLYEALTGQLPFVGRSLLALGAEITAARPTPPSQVADATVPVGLESLALRCLQADPSERPADGEAFARALDGWLRGEGTGISAARTRPPAARVLALVACVAALVAGGLVWRAYQAPPPPPVTPPAPSLTLLEPAPAPDGGDELLVLGRRLRVVVAVAGPEALRVRVGGRTLRPRDGRVEVTLELALGLQRVGVALLLPEGQGPTRELPTHELVVRCVDAPAWFAALAPGLRPPLPLPAGVSFGEREREYVNPTDRSVLVWVPPGRFRMGSDDGQAPLGEPEGPAHEVTLTRGVFLGKREVTWGQFRQFARETQRPLQDLGQGEPHDHPAWGMTWDGARDYCAWAGGRLPTEAEWEWAARGPDGRQLPWGPDAEWDPRRGNLAGANDLFESLAPVGSFPSGASAWGVEDLLGNVWEWVSDYHAPYGADAQVDPSGPTQGRLRDDAPEQGLLRGLRGGAWTSTRKGLRGSTRAAAGELYASTGLGIRLALDAGP